MPGSTNYRLSFLIVPAVLYEVSLFTDNIKDLKSNLNTIIDKYSDGRQLSVFGCSCKSSLLNMPAFSYMHSKDHKHNVVWFVLHKGKYPITNSAVQQFEFVSLNIASMNISQIKS